MPAVETVVAAEVPVTQEAAPAVELVAAAEASPSMEPIPAPAPVVATVTAPANPINLSSELQKAGLQLIETSSTPAAAPAIEAPTQPLGRKPKPPVAISNEPLQMVETQNRE